MRVIAPKPVKEYRNLYLFGVNLQFEVAIGMCGTAVFPGNVVMVANFVLDTEFTRAYRAPNFFLVLLEILGSLKY